MDCVPQCALHVKPTNCSVLFPLMALLSCSISCSIFLLVAEMPQNSVEEAVVKSYKTNSAAVPF